MEKKEVSIGPPIVVGSVTLVPVVRTSISHWQRGGVVSFFGAKQPVSLLVVTPTARVAFAITGEEIPLAQLVAEVPALKTMLPR